MTEDEKVVLTEREFEEIALRLARYVRGHGNCSLQAKLYAAALLHAERKIAAAPDLLAALVELTESLGLRESIEFPSRKACDRYEVAYREASAAIARARGEVTR